MNKAEEYTSALLDDILSQISPAEQLKTDKRMLLAAQIDDAITAKDWKKKDLAVALGKRPSEISKWLSGTHNFTTDTLFDLERVLDIEIVNIGSTGKTISNIYTAEASSSVYSQNDKPFTTMFENAATQSYEYNQNIQVANQNKQTEYQYS